MKRSSYRDRDYAFGQTMLSLRSTIRLTQAALANYLGVSRFAVGEWEAGNKYPKTEHLKAFIALAVQQQAFSEHRAAEEIRLLWQAAHQKLLLDESWLAALLAPPEKAIDSTSVAAHLSVNTPSGGSNQHAALSLPLQTTPFVGRRTELAEIVQLLSNPACRLLTLLGPGGVGKTRLALQVAAEQADAFKDGVAFVALASIGSTSEVASAIGTVLHLSFGGQLDPTGHLISYLRERQTLLVLDNFEHLLDGADLLYAILQLAPQVSILVTSSERLNLQAEWLFRVEGLAYPAEDPYRDDPPQSLEGLTDYSAVQLFIQRARQVQPDFVLNDAILTSIVRICREVVGMPLAIELAAAGLRTLPVSEIEQQIQTNLDVLATTLRDVPARHRSIRAVFDHAWNLLSESEQILLSRLAVFRGGCTMAAAESVAQATRLALANLIDKSLLRMVDTNMNAHAVTERRFILLEPIRDYALEKLAERGEVDTLSHKHASYYLALAEASSMQWDSPTAEFALEQLDREHNNMRAALQWAQSSGSSTIGLQLVGALWRFWRRGGYITEARLWLDTLLALDDGVRDGETLLVRLRALNGAAWLATDQHNFERAAELFDETRTLRAALGQSEDETTTLVNAALQSRAAGEYRRATLLLEDAVARQRVLGKHGSSDSGNMGLALYALALLCREQGDFERAAALFDEGITFFSTRGDREAVAQGWLGLSDLARDHGDAVQIRTCCELCLAVFHEFGTEWAVGFTFNNLAMADYLDGNLPQAYTQISQSVALFRGIQNEGSLAEVLISLGRILQAQGDLPGARESLLEALRLAWVIGPRLMLAGALEALASVEAELQQSSPVIGLLSTASLLRAEMGTPVCPADHPIVERVLVTVQSAVGEEVFAAVWSEAQAQPLEQLITTILGELPSKKPPSATQAFAPRSLGTAIPKKPRFDWGAALDVPVFYGREPEIQLLTNWVVKEYCRVVSVLGMGGIGKSALAVTLMRQVAENFEVVIWRSLRDLPTCDVLLTSLLQVLAPHVFSEPAPTFERRLSVLLEYMRRTRVLIVLDNLESVLQDGENSGQLRSGYEGFGRFLRQSAETEHQSCVVLTSREKPGELIPLEGGQSPVRALRLDRLETNACEALLIEKELTGGIAERTQLIDLYAGNPLALKIVSQTIAELFDADIASFLEQGEVIFGGVRYLLSEQFVRLSALEQSVFLWLAVLREPTTLDELMTVLGMPQPRAWLFEAVEALSHRSLIERGHTRGSFTLQSVVMEYATAQLITDIVSEIEQAKPKRLIEHGLELAQAPEYVRRTQERLIVTPILVQLRSQYPHSAGLEQQLVALLAPLSSQPYDAQGYGPANLLTLLKKQRGHLRGMDLSKLSLRSLHLQGVEMQDAALVETVIQDCTFTETFDAMKAVAISRNGSFWAASSRRGEVWLWEAGGMILRRVWVAHADVVPAIAFSPDERFLATCGGWDSTIKLWSVAGDALLWTGQHTSHVNGVAFSPDGRLVASSSNDATVRIWDINDGSQLQILMHPTPVSGVTWSPDGYLLATGDAEGYIRLWEVQEQEQATCVQTFSGHLKWVEGLAFSPDSCILASAGWDRVVKLWDVPSGRLRQTLDAHTDFITRVAWSPDGLTLASSGRDRVIWLWDVELNSYRIALQGHNAGVIGVGFTADSSSLLSASDDGTLRLWNVLSGQCTRILQGYADSLDDVDWSPDGAYLASGGTDTLVTIWDVGGNSPSRVLSGHDRVVNAVAWSPDGRILASSEWDVEIRFWEPTSSVSIDLLRLPQTIDNFFHSFAWSPDGRWLVAGTLGYGAQIIDRITRQTPWSDRPFSAWIHDVAWSPDGSMLAGGGDEGTVFIWDGAEGGLSHALKGHSAIVNSVVWSPDGTLLASGGGSWAGGELFLWDPQHGERVASFTEHPVIVYGVSWGESRNILISGDGVGTLRWWNIQSGECLWVRDAHQGEVKALKRSPDGTSLASCGEDGAIMLWNLSTGEYLCSLRRDRPYERLNITNIRGLNPAQKAILHALGAVEN